MAVHATVAGRTSFSSIATEVAAPFSFESLYRDFGPWILQICKQRLGNHPDAEDACQETILKAYVAMPRFRQGARLSPWLATIAVNTCTDIQRRQDRLDPLQEVADEEAPDVEEVTYSRLRQEIVREALPLVPQNYRKYICLRDFDGWSYQQIGRFYGVSIASVRSTLLRARRVLREEIKKVAEEKGQWPLPAAVPTIWLRLRSYVQRKCLGARNLISNMGSRLALMNELEAGLPNAFIFSAAAVATVIGIAIGIVTPRSADSAEAGDIRNANSAGFLAQELEHSSPPSLPLSSAEPYANESSATTDGSALETSRTPGSASNSNEGTSAEAEAAQASVSVIVGEPQNDEDTMETAPVSGSADLDGDQDPEIDVHNGPIGMNCPPPEERGIVTGVACPVLEESGDLVDDVTSTVEDANSAADEVGDSLVP